MSELTSLEEWAALARAEGWGYGIAPSGLIEIQCLGCGKTHDTFPHWGAKKTQRLARGTCSPECDQRALAVRVEHALIWGKGVCSCTCCVARVQPATSDAERFPCAKTSKTTD